MCGFHNKMTLCQIQPSEKLDKYQTVCKQMINISLICFYGTSTIVGYLMPNPLYTYILNIYNLVWLGFMAYQPL